MLHVLYLGIWWRHDIWILEKLKFDYLRKEKSFQSEIKNISPCLTITFRQTKQACKNLADTAFKDNILGADVANMQLVSKYKKGIRFLLFAIDIFRKYTWVVNLKGKLGTSIINAFQKFESGHKPNKIWVDKCSEFYNRSVESYLQDNDIEIYSTHHEGNLKGIYKYATSI